MKIVKRIILSLLFFQTPLISANEAFPHRAIFPKVQTIEIEQLYQQRDRVVIFDVRSSYEYDTLHIKDARHLSLSSREFVTALQNLRSKESIPFVFYCNGHTCKKSYKAAQKAMKNGIANVYAYDAGIFEWTKTYPDEAVLLGNSPVESSLLISKEKLNKHMLDPEDFGARVGKNAITLDIRDINQKDALNLFPTRQRSVPLDNNKLQSYVDKAKKTGKTLLVYDAVGKQVRWLQYYLEDQGLKNYYFMKGGFKAFLKL